MAFAGVFLSPETYRAIARVQVGEEVEQPGDLARELSSRGLGLPGRRGTPGPDRPGSEERVREGPARR